jgi:hypothetical protein
MAAQQRGLVSCQRRLAAIDSSRWTIPQQVDYHLVRAEMNGLDFDHRVLRPWARNPAFHVTVFPDESDQPAREGPFAYGAVELWSYGFPFTPQQAAEIGTGLRAIPKLLEQAKANLVGNARDLWVFGTKSIRQQSADLAQLASRLDDGEAELKADVERARQATDAFAERRSNKPDSPRQQPFSPVLVDVADAPPPVFRRPDSAPARRRGVPGERSVADPAQRADRSRPRAPRALAPPLRRLVSPAAVRSVFLVAERLRRRPPRPAGRGGEAVSACA